jgi:SET domain-containing protein
MLQPSPVHGIGVFAIAPIPRGCRDMFGPPDPPDAWTAIPRADIDSLPAPARHLVETYCLYDATHYFVPSHGFTRMDVSLFLNHSAQPNVVSVDDGEYFEALRDITVGEELLIDYGALVDDA